ncbi:trypsin-like peptidase domain-containing protein [Fibrella sp. HMF5335]|uniref:Trypsin-like peptidase domain-containing protein n=1 Tax=Fibrella rubiginis TaxID=2817060 RepID=A0A939K521_9BACT|nr:serine protease [Fibrella rubiginis]MBO0935995.1 trypsin-like peptidase domain-containing protein [Fibrella rubiginis]
MNNESTITETEPPSSPATYYRNLLSRGGPAGSGLESREGVGAGPDLSEHGIRERLDYARLSWQDVVKNNLGDSPKLHRIARKLVKQAAEPLRMVANDDNATLSRGLDNLARLESIVRLDGSRPSFMIRDGAVDLTTSPAGNWADQINADLPNLGQMLRCVGRIDDPKASQQFDGTGFLLAPNLLLTNRHVLDVFGEKQRNGVWKLRKGITVNFGHEFQTNTPPRVRKLKSVLFCGPDLSPEVNHADTDMALIELEPVPAGEALPLFLGLDLTPDWAVEGTFIYTVGYPANPGMPAPGSGVTFTLLEELFKSTYGIKRLAPGQLMPLDAGFTPRTLAHDATTLGGNSGSLIAQAGRLTLAGGLHYAGKSNVPRMNWGHVLEHILDATDGHSSKTVGEHLAEHHVKVH